MRRKEVPRAGLLPQQDTPCARARKQRMIGNAIPVQSRTLERFRAKWIPVRVKKTHRERKYTEASVLNSIRTDNALAAAGSFRRRRRMPAWCPSDRVEGHLPDRNSPSSRGTFRRVGRAAREASGTHQSGAGHGSTAIGERRTSARHRVEGAHGTHRDLEKSGAWPLSGRPVESWTETVKATWAATGVSSEPPSSTRSNCIATGRSN